MSHRNRTCDWLHTVRKRRKAGHLFGWVGSLGTEKWFKLCPSDDITRIKQETYSSKYFGFKKRLSDYSPNF